MPEPLALLLAGLLLYALFAIGWTARGWWDKACYLAEQKRTVQRFDQIEALRTESIPIMKIVSVPVHPMKYDA